MSLQKPELEVFNMQLKRTLLLVLSPLLLASCSITPMSTSTTTESDTGSPDSGGTSVSVDTSVGTSVIGSSITDTGDYDAVIELADDATSVTGNNVTVSGNTITITAAGTYLLSGTLSNGNILITADDDGTVELDLNGVSISKAGTLANAPIYSVNGEKLKIKKIAGSVNNISDTRTSIPSGSEDKAAIFSNKKLSIVGAGTLNVTSTFNNGIASDSKIEAKNGTLTVSGPNNGIKAHRYVLLGDESDEGRFIVTSTDGDGLKVDEDETADLDTDEFAGIKLTKGEYVIKGKDDGIDSAANIYIEDGTGSIDATTTGSRTADTGSKGIVSTLSTYLSGGTFSITSASDDAVHSGVNISVTGGSFSVSAADDGVHAEEKLDISGGLINVTSSYEGLEALYVTLSGGTTYVKASDDGINAAGGSDTQGGGWGSTVSSSITPLITISGGFNYIAASGDGIDSNGNIIVTGGTTVVSQTGNGNAPMDYGDGG